MSLKKAFAIAFIIVTLGIGVIVAVNQGWFEGLEVFKPTEIRRS